MHINWKIRLKNKLFWVTIIPTLLLLIQVVLAVFGVEINLDDLGEKLVDVVNVAFMILAILGVATDPTTEGVSDSTQAMQYTKPKTKEGEQNENN